MIPDGRGDTSNVEFVLFHIAGVSVLANPIQFRLQLLDAPDGIRSEPLYFNVAKRFLLLLGRHISQHDFADCRAIEGNACPDSRVNSQLFWRIKFLDIHRGHTMSNCQVDGFPGLMIQFLKIWQAEAADIELAQCGLPNREAGNSQMVHTIASTVEKSRSQ